MPAKRERGKDQIKWAKLDRANVNIGSIQRLLGHENRTTTEIYLHSINESERQAIKVFDEIAKKSHTNPHTSAK